MKSIKANQKCFVNRLGTEQVLIGCCEGHKWRKLAIKLLFGTVVTLNGCRMSNQQTRTTCISNCDSGAGTFCKLYKGTQ